MSEDLDLTACPNCGGKRLMSAAGLPFDGCMTCGKLWERLPPGEPFTRDGEQMPFGVPCDNCAFRGGSDERKDSLQWQHLIQSLEEGADFYCHKGVPFAAPDLKVGEVKFEFPRKTCHVDLTGEAKAYETWDTSRMRLCRGYLNRFVNPRITRKGEA